MRVLLVAFALVAMTLAGCTAPQESTADGRPSGGGTPGSGGNQVSGYVNVTNGPAANTTIPENESYVR